jgi:hypothetical protein
MKLLKTFNSFALVPRLVIGVALLALAVGVGYRMVGAVKYMIFGNVEAKRERGNTIVAQEQGQAAKETGIEATGAVVRTYERHVQVDHIVKEGQDAVRRADKGEQMATDIDAAGAAALCRVHDSLCRPTQQR